MGKKDRRVDAYIKKSAAFAKPILTELRAVVHETCPDVQETIKWRAPFFEHNGLLCVIAAFKAYCTFGFWKGSLVFDGGAPDVAVRERLGRMTTLADLPPKKTIANYIRKAMALNKDGAKPPRKPARKATPLKVPADLAAALKKNRKAKAGFEAFSSSHRNEYIQWIGEAKGADTRARRIQITMEWLVQGKSRNWKYQRR